MVFKVEGLDGQRRSDLAFQAEDNIFYCEEFYMKISFYSVFLFYPFTYTSINKHS